MRFNPPSQGFASSVVFFSAALWGLYWIPLRYLEGLGIGGGWAVALLNLPAGVALLPLVLLAWRRHRAHMGQALAIGIFTGLGLALYASGLIYSSVVRATLLFYLTPNLGHPNRPLLARRARQLAALGGDRCRFGRFAAAGLGRRLGAP